MKIFLYFSVCIISALFQTVIRPSVPIEFSFYDPLLIFILFLSQKSGLIEGLAMTMLAGLFMDGLSSGGIGFYFSSYAWFFFVVRLIGLYLRFESPLVTVFLLFTGILLQNAVFFIPEFVEKHVYALDESMASLIRSQLIWALLTGVWLFNSLSKFLTRLTGKAKSMLGESGNSDDSDLIRT